MKLLLTSAGLTSDALIRALAALVDQPLARLNVAVIPTAANVIEGDKGWLINDLVSFQKAGFARVDIVDISALDREVWEPRLREAQVIVVTGGDTSHLLHWMRQSGLNEELEALLRERVYLGISAGSMIVSPHLTLSQSAKPGPSDNVGLGLVNFLIQPHLDSPFFPMASSSRLREMVEEFSEITYGLDDRTAVMIDGDRVTVVGDGQHVIFDGGKRR